MTILQSGTTNNTKSPDSRAIVYQALTYLFRTDDVFEISLVGPKLSKSHVWSGFAGGKKPIISGWFDDITKATDVILEAGKVQPIAIYTSLNPVNPALLARAHNRLEAGIGRTQDKEIAQVRHMLVDADPVRPAGISSTDAEKEAALALLRTVYSDLKAKGWDEPLAGDSGNGGHLIYPVDSDCVGLIPDFLKALDRQYSTPEVTIDTTVGNPARLVKVYGTVTRKGDSTKDRPHRRATILSLPGEVE